MNETIEWKPYDPGWLIELAKDQCPDETWLPEALAACTKAWQKSEGYIYFSYSHKGKFETNISFHSPNEGLIILDVFEPHTIGGVEFSFKIGPQLICPCGYIYEYSVSVSNSWIAVSNKHYREFREIEKELLNLGIEKYTETQRTLVKQKWELTERIYQCPKCGRIMWRKPGEKSLHIFAPENTIVIESSSSP